MLCAALAVYVIVSAAGLIVSAVALPAACSDVSV